MSDDFYIISNRHDLQDFLSVVDPEPARLIGLRASLRAIPILFSAVKLQPFPLVRKIPFEAIRIAFFVWMNERMQLVNWPESHQFLKMNEAVSPLVQFNRPGTGVPFSEALDAYFAALYPAVCDSSLIIAAGDAADFSTDAISQAAGVIISDPASYSLASIECWKQIQFDATRYLNSGYLALCRTPLFKDSTETPNFNLKAFLNQQMEVFESELEFQQGHWGLWTAWWRNLLPDTSRSLFGDELDKEIEDLVEDDIDSPADPESDGETTETNSDEDADNSETSTDDSEDTGDEESSDDN